HQLESGERRSRDSATRQYEIRPVCTLPAPDQQIYASQRQTRRSVHRPDNDDPIHRMSAFDCEYLSVICSARLATRSSLTHVFAATAARDGFFPACSFAFADDFKNGNSNTPLPCPDKS